MIYNKIFQDQLNKVTPEIKKEMDWSAEIVKRIDQILKEKGMTRRELASKVGCNETQIVRWTRGFPNYTLSTLAKLSVALGEDLIHLNPLNCVVSGYQAESKISTQYLSEGGSTVAYSSANTSCTTADHQNNADQCS